MTIGSLAANAANAAVRVASSYQRHARARIAAQTMGVNSIAVAPCSRGRNHALSCGCLILLMIPCSAAMNLRCAPCHLSHSHTVHRKCCDLSPIRGCGRRLSLIAEGFHVDLIRAPAGCSDPKRPGKAEETSGAQIIARPLATDSPRCAGCLSSAQRIYRGPICSVGPLF